MASELTLTSRYLYPDISRHIPTYPDASRPPGTSRHIPTYSDISQHIPTHPALLPAPPSSRHPGTPGTPGTPSSRHPGTPSSRCPRRGGGAIWPVHRHTGVRPALPGSRMRGSRGSCRRCASLATEPRSSHGADTAQTAAALRPHPPQNRGAPDTRDDSERQKAFGLKLAVHWLRENAVINEFNMGGY